MGSEVSQTVAMRGAQISVLLEGWFYPFPSISHSGSREVSGYHRVAAFPTHPPATWCVCLSILSCYGEMDSIFASSHSFYPPCHTGLDAAVL